MSEESNPLKIIDGFTDSERTAYNTLHRQHREKDDHDRMWHWEVGKEVFAVLQDAKNNNEFYGKKVLERFSIALGYDTPNVLSTAAQVYERWPTKAAFREVLKMKNEADNRLTWTHLAHLASYKDEKKLMQMAAKALRKNWTARRLYQEIQNQCGSTKNAPGQGPPHKVPKAPADAMTHMTSLCVDLVKQFDNKWFCKGFDLGKELEKLPPDQVTSDLVKQVEQTRKHMRDVQAKLSEAQSKLVESESWLEECLAGGAEITLAEHRKKQKRAEAKAKRRKRFSNK